MPRPVYLTETGYPIYTAEDGWRVELVPNTIHPGPYELRLTFMYCGKLGASGLIDRYASAAAAELHYHLLAAACRFLNAGGRWEALHDLLDALELDTDHLQMTVPPGWELWSVRQTVQDVQHMFHEPKTGKVLIVAEDQYTTETTVAEMEGRPIIDVPVQPTPDLPDA